MKKLLSIILSITMLLTAFIMPVSAYSDEYTGKFYHNHFWYEYDTETKTLTVYSDGSKDANMSYYYNPEHYDDCYGLEEALRINHQYWEHLDEDEHDSLSYFFKPHNVKRLFSDDIETIVFDESITCIDNFLSGSLNSLKTIYIPSTLNYLDDFDYRSRSFDIYYDGTKTDFNRIEKYTHFLKHFGYGEPELNEFLDRLNQNTFHFAKRESAKNLKYSLSCDGYYYNGKSHTPAMTIKDATGALLKNGIDYDLEYSKGRNEIGDYKVVAYFKGDYYGQKTMHFEVKPRNVTQFNISRSYGGFNTSWYRQYPSVCDGYELQYSSFADFDAYVVEDMPSQQYYARSFKGLWRGHTYFVTIRTYKFDANGNKIYSYYSTPQRVITK